MEGRFIKRFESYRNSLNSLAEAEERDMSDSFVLSGTRAKFSITFDLAWKLMKDILIQKYAIVDFVSGSPRETLKTAFKAGLIDDDIWMKMLDVRNSLAHDYDGSVLSEHCDTIIWDYIPEMKKFCTKAEEILDL